ncbi:MAG: dual specificity protein phosphatase family protein [Alistipes sp.]|nr:dual specificity protein phosphatase family protein [Alistipes sp.]
MKIYKFAKISARCFPTIADLNNPWIFPADVAVVISVTPHYEAKIVDDLKVKGIDFYHYPLEEEVDDIGWENIKQAVEILLRYDKEDQRMIVHCDFGQHRSRLVIEAF